MTNPIQQKLGLRGGLLTLVEGPSGTGKSWLAGSIAEFGNTHVIAFKPKEVDSFQYVDRGLDYDLFHDPNWSPLTDQYESGGFLRFLRRVDEIVENDEIENVILDPLTDLHHLIKHEVLSKENASKVRDMSDAFGAWGDIGDLWEATMAKVSSLAFAPTPKNVVATVHTKVPSEDEQEKRNVEFMGTTQPALQGRIKNIIEGDFHLVLHSRVVMEYDSERREQVERYVVEARANSERHNKIALAPALKEKTLANDFSSIVDAISANGDSDA